MVRHLPAVISAISSTNAHAHFDPNNQIILAGNASADGIGLSCFICYSDGQEKTIAHASKTLNQAEKNYPQIQREALELVYGVTKFHQFLFGRRLILQTDHQPLVTIFGNKKGIPRITAGQLH